MNSASAFRHKNRNIQIVFLLLAAVIVSSLWSLAAGAVNIPVKVIINTLFNIEGPKQYYIIMRSRLPRTLLALLTGGSLAVSGTVIQGLLRNPLVSPKIIGINSGAALGVLLMFLIFKDELITSLPLFAGLGGILAASIVYFFAEFKKVSPARIALIGIAVGFVCQAGVDYILVSTDIYEISAPLVWLTGSLWSRGWAHLEMVWIPLGVLSVFSMFLSFRLDLIRLGDDTATGLGVNIRLERIILYIVATLLAAISVGVVGVMGFVGLMAPHIARKLVGGVHRDLIPASVLIGMLLVVTADAAGRAIVPPVEISAGILTAIFGAPFFVFILLSSSAQRQK